MENSEDDEIPTINKISTEKLALPFIKETYYKIFIYEIVWPFHMNK